MAMQPKAKMPHVKSTTSKGHRYYYFDTGQKDRHGKKIFERLPDPSAREFGAAYAAMMGHRSRRENAVAELTVKDLIEKYQAGTHFKGRSAGTRRIYAIYNEKLAYYLGMAPAERVERFDIANMLDKLSDTPGAANSLLKISRALFLWGRQRGLVTNDPCKDIELIKGGEHEPWPEDLLKAALECDDSRVRLGVHLLYFTAQRIGDVVRMRWGDIRHDRIDVIQEKTGRELSIPLHADLKAELDRHNKTLGTIVAGPTGKPLAKFTLRDSIQQWAKARGHSIVPHGLRKNAVIALLDAECSMAETASISGQSLRLVEHYAKRRNQGRLADAAIIKWQGKKA